MITGKATKNDTDIHGVNMDPALTLAPTLPRCRIVYRDIKQENVGFDVRGDVKIFDLGLCKELSPKLKNKDGYGYLLTPRTGAVPYMAPEVAECKPYGCECDVYSFAILVWEILSLKPAYKGYSRREYVDRVVQKEERLVINKQWPPLTRLMIREGWETEPTKRPNMKRAAVLLRGDLNEMTSDPNVKDRTMHMKQRSAHSFRISRGLARRKGGA
jgi:serine/threonine protein kinase